MFVTPTIIREEFAMVLKGSLAYITFMCRLVRHKQLQKALLQLFLLAVNDHDYKRLDTSLCSTKSWSRIGSLWKFRWFALKYFFGLSFKYFISQKTLELGVALPSRPHCCAPGGNCIFWLQATDHRRNSWLSEVQVHTDSVIQIN